MSLLHIFDTIFGLIEIYQRRISTKLTAFNVSKYGCLVLMLIGQEESFTTEKM